MRAKSHTHSNFLCSPSYRVRHHAVKPGAPISSEMSPKQPSNVMVKRCCASDALITSGIVSTLSKVYALRP